MKKYTIQYDSSAGPEDAQAGRAWDVVYTQPWQDGAYLPPVASRCTEADAKRIADCLNACEGVLAENVNVNQLILNYADLKVQYNNLRCDGLGHLRALVYSLNSRGQHQEGGCDANTETGMAWRAAAEWLAYAAPQN